MQAESSDSNSLNAGIIIIILLLLPRSIQVHADERGPFQLLPMAFPHNETFTAHKAPSHTLRLPHSGSVG